MSFLSHYTFILISILWQESLQVDILKFKQLSNSDVSTLRDCSGSQYEFVHSGFPLGLKEFCWLSQKNQECMEVVFHRKHKIVLLYHEPTTGLNATPKVDDKGMSDVLVVSAKPFLYLCRLEVYAEIPPEGSSWKNILDRTKILHICLLTSIVILFFTLYFFCLKTEEDQLKYFDEKSRSKQDLKRKKFTRRKPKHSHHNHPETQPANQNLEEPSDS